MLSSKADALKVYKDEFKSPKKKSIGLDITSMNRSAIRFVSKKAVLDSSVMIKKKYSNSVISSVNSGSIQFINISNKLLAS